MSNIPQSPHMDQTEQAQIARSASHTSPGTEGEITVSSPRTKGGVKARATTRPQDPNCVAELQKKIAELEQDVAQQKRAIEDHVRYRLEQGKKIVKLEHELGEARRGSTSTPESSPLAIKNAALEADIIFVREEWGKANREIERLKAQTAAAKDLRHTCEWQERALKAEKHNDNLAAQVEALAAQLEENGAAQVEAQAARIAILEQEHAQAVRIAEEALEDQRTLINENADLRTALAEQQETQASDIHDEHHCQQCAALREQNTDLHRQLTQARELNDENNRIIMGYQNEENWLDRLAACDELEAAMKWVVRAMRKATRGKESAYTPIYRSDMAKWTGLGEQAAGRHMNAATEWGMVSGYRTEEKAIVSDARLGQRTITKKVLNIAPTTLLEHPEEFKRGDGKQHGGSLPRCQSCHSENTLRRIYHTVCLECGHEDINMPLDAQIALDRARAVVAEDAPAAVAEAIAIITQTAPAPAPVEPVAQASDVHHEHQSNSVPEATPEEETQEQHDARMLRLNAQVWTDIEAKDPGCWVPASIITYWRTQGRAYTITKPDPEAARPRPVRRPTPPTPKKPKKTAVDFSTGSIREVDG